MSALFRRQLAQDAIDAILREQLREVVHVLLAEVRPMAAATAA